MICLPEFLGSPEDVRPDYRRVVVTCASHRLLGVEHVLQGIQHSCVNGVFLLFRLWYPFTVRQDVVIEELLGLQVLWQSDLFFLHKLIRIAILGHKTGLESLRQ